MDTYFYGYLNLPWWGYILTLLCITHVTILGVTIYLHRQQAHRSLELHPILSHFFRFWLYCNTGMVTKEWAAIHRKHHAKCETVDDPHSPVIRGIDTVLWKGVELYRKESCNQDTLERYGKGTPDDWIENNLYSRFTKLGITAMFLLDLFLMGIPGIAMWAMQMIWIPFFAAGVINGIGHHFGYRSFESPDASRNIVPFGFLVGGEELHNNHHTYPTSAKFSVKWWEFDLAWGYIKVFSWLGLAKIKRVAPKIDLIPGKMQIDIHTLEGLFVNRFQVMSRYTKEVIRPNFKQVADSSNSKVLAYFSREPSLLDVNAKQKLGEFLAQNKTMQVIYSFKENLQQLWSQSSLKESELLEALQNWCKDAEATGISSLKDFSNYVRGLTVSMT
jgi:stearoyl-CoA desaturase (delta-9 desaturase)